MDKWCLKKKMIYLKIWAHTWKKQPRAHEVDMQLLDFHYEWMDCVSHFSSNGEIFLIPFFYWKEEHKKRKTKIYNVLAIPALKNCLMGILTSLVNCTSEMWHWWRCLLCKGLSNHQLDDETRILLQLFWANFEMKASSNRTLEPQIATSDSRQHKLQRSLLVHLRM